MRFLSRILPNSPLKPAAAAYLRSTCRFFSAGPFSGGGDGDDQWPNSPASSWFSGFSKEHFDGEAVGRPVNPPPQTPPQAGPTTTSQAANAQWADKKEKEIDVMREIESANKKGKAFVDGWNARLRETTVLLKQVREPGARGSYLKDSEKAEMYKLHKLNPAVYTVEKLAQDYRVLRQRVEAILWLKKDEEEMEKKFGYPLDDAVEKLLDTCPELFNSHDREFHVASLPYAPDFKVMPEGWDGTTRDPDEVHYEISMKEDEMLYQDFLQRFNFNKLKIAKQIKCHKYSRRRPKDGWNFTIEMLGPRGKRGSSGVGWKFVSLADGSSRPLNELEKVFVKRETPRRRRKLIERD